MTEHDTGQVAASAAEIYESFFVPALFAEWPAHVLAAATVGPGDHVLDVACGTGILARAALARVGTSGSVTAIDMNDGMLAVARQRSTAVTWHEGDACALPFADNAFDHVVSQFGLMFFPDRPRALQEMRRVTRNGGQIALAVWGSLDDTPGYAAMSALLLDLFGADVANSLAAPYSLGDRDVLASLCAEAGINDAHIETVVGRAQFASLDAWLYTDIRGWTLANIINDADYARLTAAATERLSSFVNDDGGVSFAAPAHVVSFTA